MKEKTTIEMFDLLEKILIDSALGLLKQLKVGSTEQEARNLIAKIGTRIMFSTTMKKEDIDRILIKS